MVHLSSSHAEMWIDNPIMLIAGLDYPPPLAPCAVDSTAHVEPLYPV